MLMFILIHHTQARLYRWKCIKTGICIRKRVKKGDDSGQHATGNSAFFTMEFLEISSNYIH